MMCVDSKERARLAQSARVALRAGCTVFLLAMPIAAFAQGITGTLSGTVHDQQGGAIPGASVTVVNESQAVTVATVVTNGSGDFVVPNLATGTYKVQVEMPQFKTLSLPGVAVTPGSRVSVGTLVIQIGGATEVVTVTGDVVPLVQATSGERSFSVSTESVASLPLQNRSYFGLLALAPGVVPASGNTVVTRLGGGGGNNYMIDGTNTMDPSVNRPSQTVSVEAVSEVKVQTSTYSAEFGRSSGVQINAVTKSGTNKFHGAVYDVERNSKWNSNTRENILNKSPKTLQSEEDYGISIGGPAGKPGGNNRLFFYVNYERNPREFNKNRITRYRLPTLLERQGDFSKSLDNNGNPYPYVRDYLKTGNCNATSQEACFNDGGIVGKIPADRLYSTGLAILNWYPLPNLPPVPGTAYNFEITDPGQRRVGYQPLVRVDYQATQNLRGSYRDLSYRQKVEPTFGTIPGWNDGIWFDTGPRAHSASVNWTVNNKTFVEGNWGTNWVRQRGGGGLVQGAPRLSVGNPINPTANIVKAGFGDLPRIYPDQWVPEPGTLWLQGTLKAAALGASQWDGTRIQTAPRMIWGSRIANAPPDLIMPDDLKSSTWTMNVTLTRVQGSHTLKTGYFVYSTDHQQSNFDNQGIDWGQDTSNIFDTTFGFANTATGVFRSYIQDPRVEEGDFKAINREGFVQDNWKVSKNLTLDYGVRVVNISQVWDDRMKTANFLPDRWVASKAPVLYKAGCSVNVTPCPAASRVALNPVNNQLLGINSAQLVGTRVPGTGEALNGLFAAGQGIDDRLYKTPTLKFSPRTGVAWDLRGNQTFVVRGGVGTFYDRTNISAMYDSVKNPPFSQQTTMRYGFLQTLSASLAPNPASALWAIQYDYPMPISTQWNAGAQMTVPLSMVLDVAYTGQHSANGSSTVNINSIDLGTAYLPQYQNPIAVVAANPTDPNTSYASTNPDVIRFYQGYGAISMRQPILHRTYHSIQLSLNRRFKNGLSFGFYDTMGLYDKQNAAPRLQHNADGSVTVRDDQARADELLGNQNPQEHLLRANFTWRLPTLAESGGIKRMVGYAVNGWNLSGIWNGATGPYYSLTANYQSGGGNLVLTGSPDYAARVVVLPNVDLGGGCSSDPLHQFNVNAFRGPAAHSDGLESGNGYLKGCFISSLDLAIARTIGLGKGRVLELRADVFNAFNQAGITGRVTQMNLVSPSDPVTIMNLPDPATGVRTVPNGAGFGVANAYQAPRSAQLQIRVAF